VANNNNRSSVMYADYVVWVVSWVGQWMTWLMVWVKIPQWVGANVFWGEKDSTM